MADQTYILLDMDGVLINPLGYQEALRDAVDYYTQRMGLRFPKITNDEIASFEACGMTNEWLSGAFCVALILIAAAEAHPGLIRPSLEETIRSIREAGILIERPAFTNWATRLTEHRPEGIHRPDILLDILQDSSPQIVHDLLVETVADIHPPQAPAARVIQNYVLGSAVFREIYNQHPSLSTQGYLTTLDRPHLEPELGYDLQQFSKRAGHGAAIYTARPSLPPEGITAGSDGFSPEAELGLRLLGLGNLPLVASGHMRWLAQQQAQPTDAYCKPSPMHVLTALGTAISDDIQLAMKGAVDLLSIGKVREPFDVLLQTRTEMIICEDGIGGLQGGRAAVDILQGSGLDVQFTGIGIATNDAKRRSLGRVSNHIYPDINMALRSILAEAM